MKSVVHAFCIGISLGIRLIVTYMQTAYIHKTVQHPYRVNLFLDSASILSIKHPIIAILEADYISQSVLLSRLHMCM